MEFSKEKKLILFSSICSITNKRRKEKSKITFVPKLQLNSAFILSQISKK